MQATLDLLSEANAKTDSQNGVPVHNSTCRFRPGKQISRAADVRTAQLSEGSGGKHAEGIGSDGCGAGERGRRAHLRSARRRKSRHGREPEKILDPARRHEARAGSGVHGRDLWQAHGQTGRLHHHAGSGRAEPYDRRGLCPAWRDADGDDHRAKRHHEEPPGRLSDRRRGECLQAAHQDVTADRQCGHHPDPRAGCVPDCRGGKTRPGSVGTA